MVTRLRIGARRNSRSSAIFAGVLLAQRHGHNIDENTTLLAARTRSPQRQAGLRFACGRVGGAFAGVFSDLFAHQLGGSLLICLRLSSATHMKFSKGTSIASLALALSCAVICGCGTMFGMDDYDFDPGYEDESTVPADLADAADKPYGVDAVSGAQEAGLRTDAGWPVEVMSGSDRLVIYQPQVDSWEGNRIRARCAVAVTAVGATASAYGVVSISARSEVRKDTRLVLLQDLQVTAGTFAASGPGESDPLQAVRGSVTGWPRVISLDRLTADLAIARAEHSGTSPKLNHTPPRIIYSPTPTVLVRIDGAPVLRDVQDSGLLQVLNTPALLLFDPSTRRYFLDGHHRWAQASSLDGPWTLASDAPAGLERVKARLAGSEELDPGDKGNTAPAESVPTVYVSTIPAELVETWGPPQYERILGTDLVYATNTDSNIFMDVDTHTVYVLLSGRWFVADSLDGPWRWVSGSQLPHDFSRIDPYGPKGSVLMSIPGTEEARDALIANQIPQTATVNRADAHLEVRYDGTPQFKAIQGTRMQYAVNTDIDVVRAGNRYYAAKDGIWFVSDSAFGPWAVADSVAPEIYSIPPSSPLYHDRFLYVYGSDAAAVFTGYTGGYMGAFVVDDVVVYGTGWVYTSWCGTMYFGSPWTWGFGYEYSYWGGGWFSRPFYRRWWYHDWGHMHRLYSEYWHPGWSHPDLRWVHNNVNAYNRWDDGAVRAEPQLTSGIATGAGPATVRAPPRPAAGGVLRSPDLYAGRDGNVYEHRRDGWYRHATGNQWNHVGTPGAMLAHDHQSRVLGSARWSEFRGGGHAFGMARSHSLPTGALRGGSGRSAMGHSSVMGGGMGHESFGSGHH